MAAKETYGRNNTRQPSKAKSCIKEQPSKLAEPTIEDSMEHMPELSRGKANKHRVETSKGNQR